VKRVALAIGLAAIVAVIGLSTALAATTISAGNSISDQLHSDSWGKSYLVDTGTHFTGDGRVDQWKIWAENTNRVQLVIYRHSGNVESTGWSEIARDGEIRTPVVGENTFNITTPIGVEKGDFIGLYFPDDDGPVSFSLSPSNAPFQRGNFTGRVLFTAESGSTSTAFVDSSNRIYSLRATGTATEASNNDEDDEDKAEKDKDGINGNGRNFGTHLSGDEADTDSESQAQGQANFKLSKDGESLKYKLNVANIEDVRSAGLYKDDDGDDDIDGTLVASLYGNDSVDGRFQGTLAEGDIITDDLEALMEDIRAGNVYVAVFTEASDGDPEILGWLMAKGHGDDVDDEDSDASSVADDDDDEDNDEENSDKVRGWEKHDKEMKEKKEKKDE